MKFATRKQEFFPMLTSTSHASREPRVRPAQQRVGDVSALHSHHTPKKKKKKKKKKKQREKRRTLLRWLACSVSRYGVVVRYRLSGIYPRRAYTPETCHSTSWTFPVLREPSVTNVTNVASIRDICDQVHALARPPLGAMLCRVRARHTHTYTMHTRHKK